MSSQKEKADQELFVATAASVKPYRIGTLLFVPLFYCLVVPPFLLHGLQKSFSVKQYVPDEITLHPFSRSKIKSALKGTVM